MLAGRIGVRFAAGGGMVMHVALRLSVCLIIAAAIAVAARLPGKNDTEMQGVYGRSV